MKGWTVGGFNLHKHVGGMGTKLADKSQRGNKVRYCGMKNKGRRLKLDGTFL